MPEKGSGSKKRLIRKIRKGKPEFKREESWRYKRISESWRRPAGLDSKMRFGKKGWPPRVLVGHRSPRVIRGLHPSGFEEVLIHNPKEVAGVDPNRQAIRIGRTVGARKRAVILEKAMRRGVKVLNPRRTE